ncbi:hypothetical protein Rhopal_001023-T1 [Rhodotorula paludigena]|uniref:Xanthine dehydrogenase n=1 Tax=Rhodotorula paludigena TaxID=86838 RepID=A0AAV5GFE0_9BASI|nr:hypothetical protein Rhopal_001023-T1 [Rhodotorula paludigena]
MAATMAGLDAFLAQASHELTFWLNGTKVVLDGRDFDPDTSLLAFLRSQPGLTGTKQGCNEGGCGACTVVIQSIHPRTRETQHLAINACLAPLVCVEGKHVITVEGIGNSDHPHPLQERMAKLHGSQCGFCTPGIVMSVYALLRNAAYKGRLSVDDVELQGALDGNLCRCTGYAPIFKAVKSFVGEYLAPKSSGTPSLSSSSSTASSSPPSTPTDPDFSIPFNFEAAGLAQEVAQKAAKCCASSEKCAEAVSTDVSLPAPSALEEPDAPPIDPVAGLNGRTAPVSPEAQDIDASALVHPPPATAKPKGCGRADCCQLGGDKVETTAPTASFPRFDFKPYVPSTELILPPSLVKHPLKALAFSSPTHNHRRWFRPVSLEQVLDLKRALPDAKLVGGSSEIAIEVGIKGMRYPDCIYLSDVAELATVSLPTPDNPTLTFGANLTLSDLERVVGDLIAARAHSESGALRAVRDQLRYFAGRQIRNAASIGGNIATASPISDANPVWVALGAKLVVRAPSVQDGEETVLEMGEGFFHGYRKTRLPSDGIIVRVILPLGAAEKGEKDVVRAFKQARRKDDDIAIVTACFSATLAPVAGSESWSIKDIKLAFGGMAAYTITAKNAEAFLVGKPVAASTLEGALDVLASEFDLPFTVPGGMPSYRRTLVLSFFFKYWVELASACGVAVDGVREVDEHEVIEPIHRQPSSSTRDNSDPYAQRVVGTQIPHASGLKHVTGEAVFCDDMPAFANEAHLSLVLSTRAHAKILSVNAAEALDEPGVFTFVDWRDLPSEKANVWGPAAQDEYFFAKDVVTCHGQIIGAVVAKTKLQAQRAARLVKVEYEDLPHVLTVDQAIAAKSFHESYNRRMSRGKPISDALAAAEHTLSSSTFSPGQEHFYLETQACLAIPKLESGELEIVSSTQALTETQHYVAQATGVPRNRIVAKTKRLGGGFGGKLSAVCAVAAKKLRRPVRCMLERHEDIKISGQRHPFRTDWTVGFTSEGKITALDAEFYANAGYSLDISGGVADRAIAHATNAYYVENVDVRAKLCKTNTVSNTAFRAIATFLQLDIDHVRAINLFKEGDKTHYHQSVIDLHVPRLMTDLERESDYVARKAAVERFNHEHRFRKRGITLVPTLFGLAFGVKAMNRGSALVHIYLDGSVLVAHGGTEMGQGLYSKCLQIAAEELKVPFEAVFTSESATNTVANTVPTAASAGSDLNGYAVLNACRELNERLAPFREKLGPDAPMSALAAAATGERVSLSATGHHATPNLGYVWNVQEETGPLFHYYTQGAAATEVEIDLLTGDHTVLRTDIKMDVGRSLNPAIDYGQIEGAFVQGQGWCTLEETTFLQNGALFTTGPGAYKVMNVSLLRDAEWPNLGSVHSSKGIGEPPFFLGCSVALALRHALASARLDAGLSPDKDRLEFRYPLTSERIRLAAGDRLVRKGEVKPKKGEEEKGFFVLLS